MNRKQLLILCVLVLLLGGLGLVLLKRKDESWNSSATQLGQKLLPGFQVNDVAQIRFQEDSELNLVRKSDIWQVRERGGYPANFSKISEFLVKFSDFKIAQTEPIGASQLGRLKLEGPGKGSGAGMLVEFRDQNQKVLNAVLLGKKHTRRADRAGFGPQDWPDGRYVLLRSKPQEALLISDPLSSIDLKPESWLQKEFFKIEHPKTISYADEVTTHSWKLARESEAAPWVLSDLQPGEALDTNKITSIGSTLGSLNFVDVLPDAKNELTGLDKPSMLNIETFDHFHYLLKFGGRTSANNVYVSASVTADLPKERTPGKDEKPEDKVKLDKEFADKLRQLQEKLKQEQAFGSWVYTVNSWVVDPLTRERLKLLVNKEAKAADSNMDSSSEPGSGDDSAGPEVPAEFGPEK